jgi:hypothetical protein
VEIIALAVIVENLKYSNDLHTLHVEKPDNSKEKEEKERKKAAKQKQTNQPR